MILITGGSGFVGQALIADIEDEYQTINYDLKNGDDILDGEKLKRSLKDVDIVFHLAAQTSVQESIKNPEYDWRVNVGGTKQLIEAVRGSDVDKIIYASTAAVYGMPEYIPIDEMHPLRPISPYGRSKLEGEKMLRIFYEESGVGLDVLRIFNIYGFGERENLDVIRKMLSRLKGRQRPVIYGDGEQSRDFIFIDDVIKILRECIEGKKDRYNLWNVGTGRETEINKIYDLLCRYLSVEYKPIYQDRKEGDIYRSCADIQKLKSEMDIEEFVDIDEGIKKLIDRSR